MKTLSRYHPGGPQGVVRGGAGGPAGEGEGEQGPASSEEASATRVTCRAGNSKSCALTVCHALRWGACVSTARTDSWGSVCPECHMVPAVPVGVFCSAPLPSPFCPWDSHTHTYLHTRALAHPLVLPSCRRRSRPIPQVLPLHGRGAWHRHEASCHLTSCTAEWKSLRAEAEQKPHSCLGTGCSSRPQGAGGDPRPRPVDVSLGRKMV